MLAPVEKKGNIKCYTTPGIFGLISLEFMLNDAQTVPDIRASIVFSNELDKRNILVLNKNQEMMDVCEDFHISVGIIDSI